MRRLRIDVDDFVRPLAQTRAEQRLGQPPAVRQIRSRMIADRAEPGTPDLAAQRIARLQQPVRVDRLHNGQGASINELSVTKIEG